MNLTKAHLRQAVQTATAGVLAMYLSSFLGLPESYWAAITAMIVLQASLGAALKESWVRVAATAIGAAVAIPVVAYFGSGLFIFAAAVFVTVLLCSTLRLTAGLRVAATTVAIIMLIPKPGHPWSLGIHRFLEVSFGIVVALVVAKFVWPSSALEDLRQGLATTYTQLNSLFVALLQRYRGEARQEIEQLRTAIAAALRNNDDLHEQATYEVAFRRKNPKTLVALAEHANRICRKMDALDLATQVSPTTKNVLRLNLEPELSALGAGIAEGLNQIAQGLSSKQFPPSDFDFQQATQALDTEAAKLHNNPDFARYPLQAVLQSDSLCLALQALACELAETLRTTRGAKL